MNKNHFRNLLLLLAFSGLLLSACGPSAPTEAKTVPADKAADQQPAAPAPVAEPAPAPAPKAEARRAAPVAPRPVQVTPPAPAPAPAPVPVPAPVVPPAPAPQAETAPPPPPAPAPAPIPVIDTKNVTVPSGTSVTILMIDSVDSKTAKVNDTFRATIDQPVRINNDVVFQKGADAVVRLTNVATAGNVKGKSEIQLVLDHVVVNKKSYAVDTNTFEAAGDDQAKKAVRNGALGAALGAAIGAIAGGGKGAAIGAGAGGGGGVGTAVLMKDQVSVPSETKLMFTLTQPVDVTIMPNAPDSVPRGATAVQQRNRFGTDNQQQTDPNDRPRVRRRQF
jgi:hypothetical protein